MLSFCGGLKIFLAVVPCDLRKSFNGLHGLVTEQLGEEPMKFLSLADWTGIVETELLSKTYRTYGLATVRYPVLEIEARVEPFENGRDHTLRAMAARKPRTNQ